MSFGCDVDKPCPGFRLRWLLSAERQLALREPGCPPRTRLEESETGPANAAGSVFYRKSGGEKDFSEKRKENLKSPLAFFPESAIILKQSFPRPLEGVADIEGCDGHIH